MIHFKGLQISFYRGSIIDNSYKCVWHKFAALIYTSAQKHLNYSLQICVISKHLNQINQSINAINLPRNSQLWVDRVQPFLPCAVQSCLKWRRCQKCYIVDVGWWCCRTDVSSLFWWNGCTILSQLSFPVQSKNHNSVSFDATLYEL